MGRDLGQVRHHEDLVVPRQGPQAAPDRIGRPTADARVDLVEHEGRRGVCLGQDLLDRQGDPRQLAPGGDVGQRPGRLAGVRGEPEHGLVDPGRIERDRVTIELDRGLICAGGPPSDTKYVVFSGSAPSSAGDSGAASPEPAPEEE